MEVCKVCLSFIPNFSSLKVAWKFLVVVGGVESKCSANAQAEQFWSWGDYCFLQTNCLQKELTPARTPPCYCYAWNCCHLLTRSPVSTTSFLWSFTGCHFYLTQGTVNNFLYQQFQVLNTGFCEGWGWTQGGLGAWCHGMIVCSQTPLSYKLKVKMVVQARASWSLLYVAFLTYAPNIFSCVATLCWSLYLSIFSRAKVTAIAKNLVNKVRQWSN